MRQQDNQGPPIHVEDEGAPRIRPVGATALAEVRPTRQIEVELRAGALFDWHLEEEAAPSVAAPPGGVVSRLNQVLQKYGLERIEPSFGPPFELPPGYIPSTIPEDLPAAEQFLTLFFEDQGDLSQAVEELRSLEEVANAVVVPTATPPQTPLNEPRMVPLIDRVVVDDATGLENQWYIPRCKVDRAWNWASGEGVVVVDIDWGYRTTHEEIQPRIDLSHAYNSFDGSNGVSNGPYVSHGTAVLGLVGAADNNRGMAGVAFGATFWPIQANAGAGKKLKGNPWTRAIEWVRVQPSPNRKIIILEVQTGAYGNYEMVPSTNAAIRRAIASGVVVCVAAGNGDRDAGIDDTGRTIPPTGSILVGATEYDPTINRRASFSNWGFRVTVSAPGDLDHDLTCSHVSNAGYRNSFGGTSGATPKVAGVAALMLQTDPSLSHSDIREILRRTGSPVVTTPAKPVGRFLNAEAAVQEVLARLPQP